MTPAEFAATVASMAFAMLVVGLLFLVGSAIRTLSSGRASYSMQPSHFEQVPQQIVDQIVEQRGGKKS